MNYDIKPERIEIESRRTNRKVSRERPLWVDIMLGIVGAMIAIWAIWFAGITFFAWGLTKTVEVSAEKARVQQVQEARYRQEALERQRHQAKIREVAELERQRSVSPHCKFWRDRFRTERDEKSRALMNEHCLVEEWEIQAIMQR